MKLAHALIVLTVGAGMVPPLAAQAQVKPPSFLIGPWVGVNFATFGATNIPGYTYSTRTGLAVGGELESVVSPTLFVRAGAFYSQRGAKFNEAGGGGSGTFRLSAIEFPIVLGYRFRNSSLPITPYVAAGVQFGIKSSCTEVDNVSTNGTGSQTCSAYIGSPVSTGDFGLTFGAGFGYRAGSGTVVLDARYYDGVTNGIRSSTETITNRGFTIAAGYMIPIGGT